MYGFTMLLLFYLYSVAWFEMTKMVAMQLKKLYMFCHRDRIHTIASRDTDLCKWWNNLTSVKMPTLPKYVQVWKIIERRVELYCFYLRKKKLVVKCITDSAFLVSHCSIKLHMKNYRTSLNIQLCWRQLAVNFEN